MFFLNRNVGRFGDLLVIFGVRVLRFYYAYGRLSISQLVVLTTEARRRYKKVYTLLRMTQTYLLF